MLTLQKSQIPLHLLKYFESKGALPAKNDLGIPWRCAFALQADGWWLRSAITWVKKAPMPESVTDRPSSATEMVFMFAKSERYYWDKEAVAEPLTTAIHKPGNNWHPDKVAGPNSRGGHSQWDDASERAWGNPAGRNMRNYIILGPEQFTGSHFAVWPKKLVEPMILAGTSAAGVCGAKKTKLQLRKDLTPSERAIAMDFLRQKGWA